MIKEINNKEVNLKVQDLVPRKILNKMMKRSNTSALLFLCIHLIYLAVTGYGLYLAIDTSWWLMMSIIYGLGIVHLFSPQHEFSHRTAFKNRWINDFFGWTFGLIIALPPVFFRWEHTDHHSYTQDIEKDPELIPTPSSFLTYLWYITSVPYWMGFFKSFIPHLLAIIPEKEAVFIPDTERWKVIWEARFMLILYSTIAYLSLYYNSTIAVEYWLLPRLIAEPLMRMVRYTEHAGCPLNNNILENTRTTLVIAPYRWLAWNMPYHAEHHMAPSLPFHALPELHEHVKDKLVGTDNGFIHAHLDIIRAIPVNKI